MSSSTSSSNHRRFFLWVALAVVVTNVVVLLVPWGGISDSKRAHQKRARELAEATDFLIVGDSKAGPFSVDGLNPWLDGYRGLTFSGDSVTPVFHYDNLLEIREQVPGFRPRVVFIFVGANNFNKNGQHVEREFTFFSELGLRKVWQWSAAQGDVLSFVEAVLSRAFPLYGRRVMITHLEFHHDPQHVFGVDSESFAKARSRPPDSGARNPIYDKNYYDIYRRSMYASYQSSPIIARATEDLIELVRSFGGVPVLVLPPVTPEIRALEHELIGDAFDQTLSAIVRKERVQVLDLRDQYEFEFLDVNHLSQKGARDVAIAFFLPIVAAHPPETRAAKADPAR